MLPLRRLMRVPTRLPSLHPFLPFAYRTFLRSADWRAVAACRKAEREAQRPVVPPLRLNNIRRG